MVTSYYLKERLNQLSITFSSSMEFFSFFGGAEFAQDIRFWKYVGSCQL